MAIRVKKFWTEPEDPPLSARSISFGYINAMGNESKYKAEIKNGDAYSFHSFVLSLLGAKRKSLLPWPIVKDLKNKVKITNLKADVEQMELPLKVAFQFISEKEILWVN